MVDPPKKIVFDNYDTTVTGVYIPVENLNVYTFKLPPGKQINFIPGQYVSVMVPVVGPAPMSIASSPTKKEEIELAIDITGGPHTSWINRLAVGDHCTLRGPFGTFVLAPGEKKVAFIAGGTGVTPFISMLRWIRDTKQDIKATFFYSGRTKGYLLWVDEMEQMMRECPNIKVVFTVTREDPPDWPYYKGRFNADIIRKELPDYMDTVFYTCGPPALIEAMFTTLKEMGVPPERMKKENW